jgi:exosortase K
VVDLASDGAGGSAHDRHCIRRGSGEGYFSRERLFLIEKSCAGINFMIAAFAMVAVALLHRVRSVRAGAGVVAVSLLASYAAAVA